MSPLATTPTRGYADWQRVDNWDSPVLFTDNQTTNLAIRSPIIDVSRYAYLGGNDLVNTNAALVTLTWFTDAAGANIVGQRQFMLSPNVGQPAQYRLPNLGPFVQMSWTPFNGQTFSHFAFIIGTNRAHPLEFIPVNAWLFQQFAVNVNAGATTSFQPNDYYAGPIQIYLNPATTSSIFRIRALTTGDSDQIIMSYAPTSAGNQNLVFITPPGYWYISYTNNSAAAVGLTFSIVATVTGGS